MLLLCMRKFKKIFFISTPYLIITINVVFIAKHLRYERKTLAKRSMPLQERRKMLAKRSKAVKKKSRPLKKKSRPLKKKSRTLKKKISEFVTIRVNIHRCNISVPALAHSTSNKKCNNKILGSVVLFAAWVCTSHCSVHQSSRILHRDALATRHSACDENKGSDLVERKFHSLWSLRAGLPSLDIGLWESSSAWLPQCRLTSCHRPPPPRRCSFRMRGRLVWTGAFHCLTHLHHNQPGQMACFPKRSDSRWNNRLADHLRFILDPSLSYFSS